MDKQTELESTVPSDLKGRYIDFKYVGQGGMGRIVSATDTNLDKRVGIKILPPTVVSDTAVARFHQEAKAVSKLNHPNIVQVLDFGFASTGEPFLVMEFVQGETLDSVIDKNKKLPLRSAVKLAIQICTGLEHAHAHGIVHRDLKPANIMLDENNQVKILDFGLAKILDEATVDWRLTKPGQAMGSPLYMSLEQLRGEEVDTRSDIYSLGLVIYKMVTGQVPFEDENMMKVIMGRMQLAPPVLPPDEGNPLLSDALNAVIEVALQREADDRFESMTELKEALIEVDNIPDPKNETEEEQHWYQNEHVVKQLRSIVIGLVVVGSITAVYLYGRNIHAPIPASKFGPDNSVIVKDSDLTIKTNTQYGIPEGFELDDGVKDLWVAESRLTDDDLKRLRGSGVQKLSLESNKSITVDGIKTISPIPLKSLVLRGTNLDNSVIPVLNKMKTLEALDIRSTLVTDDGIKQFDIFPNMKYVDLGYLTGVTDASIPEIKRAFPNMNVLILKDTKVTGKGLKQLLPHKFYSMILTDLKLTDDDMDTILKFQPERLTLEDNPITDKGLEKLKKLPRMEHLSVEFCKNVSLKKLEELKQKFGEKMNIRYPTQDTGLVIDGMNELKEPEHL